MKKALIVVATVPKNSKCSMNWFPLRDEIAKHLENAKLDMTALTKLIFDISNDNCKVIDAIGGVDVADYDFVIIRNVGKRLEIGIALAHYLTIKKVPFIDSYLDMCGSGKLSCSLSCLKAGLSIPHMVYAAPGILSGYLERSKTLDYPFVLKADNGRKGRDNYLIKSKSDLEQKLKKNNDIAMIAQEFIPNDGDYRALVIGNKISLVIKRTAKDKTTHLNNVSQGATAEIVSEDILSKEVKAEIIKATRSENLEVAGVDVIFDANTKEHYFLEINRAPQIGTGAFADKKIKVYADLIKEYTSDGSQLAID